MKKTGRPPLSEMEKTVNASISLPRSYKEFLEGMGAGNVSAGVRRLVAEKLEEGRAEDVGIGNNRCGSQVF